MTINPRTRFGALALMAVFAIGACSNGGATASPSAAESMAAESMAAESMAPTVGGAPECLSFADIYALVGPESESVATWDQAATIAGELGSNTEFPAGVPISITAPGEESGTYDSFIEIVLEDYADERGQEPTTRLSNYQSSANDNAIIDGIANSAGSFGWVGFAFYEENLDRVKAFTIAAEPNGTCIEPTAATIADNSYPISRDLFIYVNKAKMEANPALVAYVDYYLADGTIQGILETTVPYVPLAPDALAQTQTAWTDFKGSAAADPDGTIFVSGSSTVEPISNAVAEAFKAANAGFNYTVEGPGTGDGFARFCAGEIDISDASRPISEEEVATCGGAGIEYVELKVAIDGIAVMTQK